MEFRPSFKCALLENWVVFIGLVSVAPISGLLYDWVTDRKGLPTYAYFGVGIGVGIGLFFYYTIRYCRGSPIAVELSTSGIKISRRNGKNELFTWPEVKSASHQSKHGLIWTFDLGDRVIRLRDDGFSTSQWDAISSTVTRSLKTAGVPISRDFYGKIFDD